MSLLKQVAELQQQLDSANATIDVSFIMTQKLGLTFPEKCSSMYDTGTAHTQDSADCSAVTGCFLLCAVFRQLDKS